MEKAEIKKLNDLLKRGDQSQIANLAGISKPHVNRFFNGNDHKVSEDNETKILKAAATVIKNREKLQKKNSELINSL